MPLSGRRSVQWPGWGNRGSPRRREGVSGSIGRAFPVRGVTPHRNARGRRRPVPRRLATLADLEDLRAARRANAFRGRPSVLHRDRLGVLDLLLCATLHTVAFHSSPPPCSGCARAVCSRSQALCLRRHNSRPPRDTPSARSGLGTVFSAATRAYRRRHATSSVRSPAIGSRFTHDRHAD
jgi:hypothetical protein